MSRRKQTRDIQKFIRKFFKQIVQLAIAVTKAMMQWVLRVMLVTRQPQRRNAKTSGFILPTVTLLLIVVGLVIGAILFRTGSRTNQVISDRNQQVILNAATPAVDRAKAKMENLFRNEPNRLPPGVPPENRLLSMMLNEDNPEFGLTTLSPDPYTLRDERRIDINGDGRLDNAWVYRTQPDNPNSQTIAYSIIFRARDNSLSPDPNFDPRQELNDKDKAAKLIVRNGPITSRQGVTPACRERLNAAPLAGWDSANNAVLRKTFQVTAVVSGSQNNNRTLTTLEFQQDREVARGNLWGAWFRYDMHIHPRPEFRWNGAVHTEGSLFLGGRSQSGGVSVHNYLISSPESCLYLPINNSEISVGEQINPATNAIAFKGQVVNGTISPDNFDRPGTNVHIFGQPPIFNGANVLVNKDNDSVERGSPSQIALDPVALFTRGISQSSDSGDRSNEGKSVLTWRGNQASIANGRLKASAEPPPFVDDTYRADDRLGPKPQYETLPRFRLGDTGNLKNGTPIRGAGLTSNQLKQMLNNTPDALDDNRNSLGLDGYWERRARVDGMRVIVSPRLELGNLYGWGSDQNNDGDFEDRADKASEPLYPPTTNTTDVPGAPGSIPHEQQQRRTLRDNLSAVQATAVYYNNLPSGLPLEQVFPVACISTTAHPGTANTIARSTNFQGVITPPGNPANIYANFFTGQGTNGWEYNTPPQGLSGVWDTAIRNLANFAGDFENAGQNGAFPPTQGSRVFPNRYISMWGNFSNLRRAIQEPLSPESIADQTYKQTAACTMGILARSIVDIQNTATANLPNFTNWDTAMQAIPAGTTLPANATLENYISAIPAGSLPPAADLERLRIFSLNEQIKRDRWFGFVPIPTPTTTPNATYDQHQYTVQFAGTGTNPVVTFGGITYDATITGNNLTASPPRKKFISLSCDISSAGNNNFGLGTITAANEPQFIRLAVSLCSSGQPKFPSLRYLFPDSTSPLALTGNRSSGDGTTDNNEPYIQQGNAAGGATFQPLNPADIALQPRAWGSWQTPTRDPDSRANPNEIRDGGGNRRLVSFLDSVFFDGREHMPVRVLDMDINLLTGVGNNVWNPNQAMIFYAFREDAVREDAISRPASGNTYADARNPDNPTDPRLDPDTLISPKPVDFLPDPDRRPYGFRLRNGANISRPGSPRGLTFVSDNLVAIQGNFNLHSNNNGASNNMQEFNQRIGENATGTFSETEFYGRRANDLNTGFANPAQDSWRPTEILADVTAIFSSNFREGSIADGISGVLNNSFASLNGPANNRPWIREDGLVYNGNPADLPPNPNPPVILPVKISRNGNPLYCPSGPNYQTSCAGNPTEYTGSDPYVDFTNVTRKVGGLNVPNETQVNAILVSGVVPARANQGNGGLHNFPRLLERWTDVPLRISGSLMQLNFSTSATGPYEQDSWEPTSNPQAGEQNTLYYDPPNRVWGYDVGLQYAPAGPLSVRLTQTRPPRSEFYEEPRANDPYVCNLRYALGRSGLPGTETTAQIDQDCRS